MLCDECKKNQATYHEIKKINGDTRERHLCAECQINQSAKNQNKLVDFADMFSGFKGLFDQPRRSPLLKCSKCGTSSDEFLETAYVGCPDCYNELKSVINPIIQKVQGASVHKGKSPYVKTPQDKESEYQRLQNLLEDAINRNEMGEAETIFDQIRKLKNS